MSSSHTLLVAELFPPFLEIASVLSISDWGSGQTAFKIANKELLLENSNFETEILKTVLEGACFILNALL